MSNTKNHCIISDQNKRHELLRDIIALQHALVLLNARTYDDNYTRDELLEFETIQLVIVKAILENRRHMTALVALERSMIS